MRDTILQGQGREMLPLARAEWEGRVRTAPEICAPRLAFMGPDHHRVRSFVVEELARRGEPLPVESIAASLELAPERAGEILGELERRLFFLVRDDEGAVSWAFPVTVDRTPHALAFSTGERLHGA